MQTKIGLKKIFFGVGVLVLISGIIFAVYLNKNPDKPNTFEIQKTANHSSGTYWTAELLTENIVRPPEYSEQNALGSGYTQVWSFEIINPGEFSVYWEYYEGDKLVQDKSYTETYAIQ
jgi:predicted secreted protein